MIEFLYLKFNHLFMAAIWVFIGGGLGSLARYGISLGLQHYKPANFPVATLVANVLSCIVLGILTYTFAHKIQSDQLKALVIIGFCGGFSTFSTFSNETFQLLKEGHLSIAVLNIVISITLCLLILYSFYFLKK